MRLKRLSIFLLVFYAATAYGQTTCFEDFRKRGNAEIKKGNWETAIRIFQAAKLCDTLSYTRLQILDSLVNTSYKRWFQVLDKAQRNARKEKEQADTERKNTQLLTAFNSLTTAKGFIEKHDFNSAYGTLQFVKNQNYRVINSLLIKLLPFVSEASLKYDDYAVGTANGKNYVGIIERDGTSRLPTVHNADGDDEAESGIPYKISVLQFLNDSLKTILTYTLVGGRNPEVQFHDDFLVFKTATRFCTVNLNSPGSESTFPQFYVSPDISRERIMTIGNASLYYTSSKMATEDSSFLYHFIIGSFLRSDTLAYFDNVANYRYFRDSRKLAIVRKETPNVYTFLLYKVHDDGIERVDSLKIHNWDISIPAVRISRSLAATRFTSEFAFLSLNKDSTKQVLFDVDSQVSIPYEDFKRIYLRLQKPSSSRTLSSPIVYLKSKKSRQAYFLLERSTKKLSVFDSQEGFRSEVAGIVDFALANENKVILHKRRIDTAENSLPHVKSDSLLVFTLGQKDTVRYAAESTRIINDSLIIANENKTITFYNFNNLETPSTSVNFTDRVYDFALHRNPNFLVVNYDLETIAEDSTTLHNASTILYSLKSRKELLRVKYHTIAGYNLENNYLLCSTNNPNHAILYYLDTSQDRIDTFAITLPNFAGQEYELSYFDRKKKLLVLASIAQGNNQLDGTGIPIHPTPFSVDFPPAITVQLYGLETHQRDTILTTHRITDNSIEVVGDYLLLRENSNTRLDTEPKSLLIYKLGLKDGDKARLYSRKYGNNIVDINYVQAVFNTQ